MADDARIARTDLTHSETDVLRAGFFELLRQLETAEQRFGRAGEADREPARLGQNVRMGFAVSDVAEMGIRDDGVPEVLVNVLGLLGPEGPMPLHITRWAIQRLSSRWFSGDSSGATSDTAFLDFANLLQHRMIALYWRAWADARPEIQVAHGDGGRVTSLMRALSGLGLPGTMTGDNRIDGAKLHHATSLAQEAQSPERLTSFLETVIGLPVQLEEFIGSWIEVPERLQTRLGHQFCDLGTEAVAGSRVFDRQSQAELRLGPMTREEFENFLDDPERWDRLRHAVIFASGKELKFSLRLVLAKGEAPPAQLGNTRLGRTSWLSPDLETEADELCFTDFVETNPMASGLAA